MHKHEKLMRPEEKRVTGWFWAFLVNLLLCLVNFYYFWGSHFSVDSYGVYLRGFSYRSYWSGYRYVGAMILKLLAYLGRNPILDDTPEIIIYCVVASFLTARFAALIAKKLAKYNFLTYFTINLAVLLTVMNVITGNQMSFPECVTINTVGLMCCFGAVFMLHAKRSIFRCVLASVLLIMAIATFQFYLALFAVYMLVVCMAEIAQKHRDCERATVGACMKTVWRPALVFVISLCLYFVLGEWILQRLNIEPQDRIGLTCYTIAKNIIYYFLHQHTHIRWLQVFNGDYMTVLFAGALVTWIWVTVKSWKAGEHVSKIVASTAVFLMAYMCLYILPVVSAIKSIRAMGPMFGIYLLLLVGILVRKAVSQKAVVVFTCILSCALAINMLSTSHHQRNLLKTNELDEAWANAVLQSIYDYEEESGITVSQIAFCQDEDPVFKYFTYTYSESAMSRSWAQDSILNVYRREDHVLLTKVDMPEEIIAEYYAGKDWNETSIEEQVVIIGDTAYICCW